MAMLRLSPTSDPAIWEKYLSQKRFTHAIKDILIGGDDVCHTTLEYLSDASRQAKRELPTLTAGLVPMENEHLLAIEILSKDQEKKKRALDDAQHEFDATNQALAKTRGSLTNINSAKANLKFAKKAACVADDFLHSGTHQPLSLTTAAFVNSLALPPEAQDVAEELQGAQQQQGSDATVTTSASGNICRLLV
jgi:hypothetical protein